MILTTIFFQTYSMELIEINLNTWTVKKTPSLKVYIKENY